MQTLSLHANRCYGGQTDAHLQAISFVKGTHGFLKFEQCMMSMFNAMIPTEVCLNKLVGLSRPARA